MSIDAIEPNFKVEGQIWKFHKNRGVDPQVGLVAIFWWQIRVQQVLRPRRRDFVVFLLF